MCAAAILRRYTYKINAHVHRTYPSRCCAPPTSARTSLGKSQRYFSTGNMSRSEPAALWLWLWSWLWLGGGLAGWVEWMRRDAIPPVGGMGG